MPGLARNRPATPCAPRTEPTPAAPGTRIIVLGPATLGAAEAIPIILRANIVLTTLGGAVTLRTPEPAVKLSPT